MLCEFERVIYPPGLKPGAIASYMVALYNPCEKVVDGSGNRVFQIKAVGSCLPMSDKIRYNMQGKWSKSSKHGLQFEVETYDEVIIPSKEGIIAYLSSGQINGIGPALAKRIYDTFGDRALDVLDKEPEKLLTITGISQKKLEKIRDSYLANRGARDVVAFLTPHGVSANRAVKLYLEYGNKTMDIVKNHPYQLCELAGIGFLTADKIAKSMGVSEISVERVDAALIYTLTDAETKGHLCMEKHAFVKACLKLLDTKKLTEEMVANRASRLVYEKKLICYEEFAYREKTAIAETALSVLVKRQLESPHGKEYFDLDAELDAEERKLKLRLAPEQRDAVKMALTKGLSIVTGGPGTGKTLIQRAILDIYSKNYPDSVIACCAPTGRAARRMEQSTGRPSMTVHKLLGLFAGDDGSFDGAEEIDADLILVDETSMLDIYLAKMLFESVKKGAQLILIGDSDQLPSVGPGAVLSELIASEVVPVVRLDKVFRQTSGSRIATNAKLIRHGNLNLEYGDDFQFLDSPDLTESAQTLVKIYMEEIQKYGVDNVALLTPYRQKTDTGVNALNVLLQDEINPKQFGKQEVTVGKKVFRVGDKVMQIKNCEDVNNGDVGYIDRIIHSGNEVAVEIDFGDDRKKTYDVQDMDMVDLGYASTVHKSQGSEYASVIINLQCAHSIMLTRPLIYTAITRGKQKVIIVGERRAQCIAIKRTDTEKRGTCLARKLKKIINS